ncbi:MAG: hypothetical protein K9L66_00255 [Spirochaetaceae bacterium]|nr:hypothetical protein [Spirochaetaceae bacterium]MCF7947177.1 hypothetical protein [Spirochaetia bacterium]MCF7950042.1 hypothetical protein [Spirochaetaceae bacterium]
MEKDYAGEGYFQDPFIAKFTGTGVAKFGCSKIIDDRIFRACDCFWQLEVEITSPSGR